MIDDPAVLVAAVGIMMRPMHERAMRAERDELAVQFDRISRNDRHRRRAVEVLHDLEPPALTKNMECLVFGMRAIAEEIIGRVDDRPVDGALRRYFCSQRRTEINHTFALHARTAAGKTRSLRYISSMQLSSNALVPIRTPRLRLDPVSLVNTDELWALMRSPYLRDYQDIPKLPLERFRERVSARPPKFVRGAVGRFEWLLRHADSAESIGWVSVRTSENHPFRGELGYTILKEWRRRGFGTEAVEAIIDTRFFVGRGRRRRCLLSAGKRRITQCLAASRPRRAAPAAPRCRGPRASGRHITFRTRCIELAAEKAAPRAAYRGGSRLKRNASTRGPAVRCSQKRARCKPLVQTDEPFAIDESAWSDRTLDNGLRAVVLADSRSPTVAVTVGYHVGGKDDPEGRSGFAHLFEHLMFKGTKHTPAETIDRLTEDVGGFNNAYTTADCTVYYEVVPANYLETMLWAEADRLSSLIVDDRNFATERDVVIGEYDQRILAEPYGMLDELVERQVFRDHAYANGVIGDPASLRASTLDDVQRFHGTYYRPDNAVLVVVGDLDVAQTNGWIDRYFSGIVRPAGNIPRAALPQHAIPAAGRLVHRSPNVPLTAFNYAYRLPAADDEDAAVIDVIEFILGIGKSSRLYKSLIHEAQLASQAFTDANMREHAGLFQVRAVLHEDIALQASEEIVRREIARMCDDYVLPQELRRAQNQLASMLVRRSETANDRALAMVTDTLLRGDPRAVEEDARRYAACTLQDVRRVSQRIFAQPPAVLEYRPTEIA